MASNTFGRRAVYCIQVMSGTWRSILLRPCCRAIYAAAVCLLIGVAAGAAESPPKQPGKTHWSFIKPARPAEPQVKDLSWIKNPIDRFVLARLEKDGIRPSPEASRETLIRRVCLDLTG